MPMPPTRRMSDRDRHRIVRRFAGWDLERLNDKSHNEKDKDSSLDYELKILSEYAFIALFLFFSFYLFGHFFSRRIT